MINHYQYWNSILQNSSFRASHDSQHDYYWNWFRASKANTIGGWYLLLNIGTLAPQYEKGGLFGHCRIRTDVFTISVLSQTRGGCSAYYAQQARLLARASLIMKSSWRAICLRRNGRIDATGRIILTYVCCLDTWHEKKIIYSSNLRLQDWNRPVKCPKNDP